MKAPDDFLAALFTAVRRETRRIGIAEYRLAVDTIREQYQMPAAAKQAGSAAEIDYYGWVGRLLWIKSHADQEAFERIFTELQARYTRWADEQPDSPKLPTPDAADEKNRIMEDVPPPLAAPLVGYEGRVGDDSRVAAVSRALESLLPNRLTELPPPRPTRSFQFTPRLALAERDLIRLWQPLRLTRRTGPLIELDVAATIAHISRAGFLTHPVLHARTRRTLQFLVLIDQGGSMAPFSLGIAAFLRSIGHGSLRGHTTLRYFQNYPGSFLQDQPEAPVSLALEQILALHAGNPVLIVSDAGAARGHYRARRVSDTRWFLEKLQAKTQHYAWLNPVPARRWPATSAAEIADLVPMFPWNTLGIQRAVQVLRGDVVPLQRIKSPLDSGEAS